MRRNTLIQKILGGVLALGMIAAFGMGSSSTASAAGFDRDGGRRFVAERHDRDRFIRRDDHFGGDRFYYGGRFYAGPRCR
jgi:hypothetical protein